MTRSPVRRIGERFGELVILSEVPRGERVFAESSGRNWVCECDCGRITVRSTRVLMATRKRGGSSCCHECADELRSGWREDRQQQRRKKWQKAWRAPTSTRSAGFRWKWWTETGSMYTHWDEENMTEDIRAAMGKWLGFSPEELPPVPLWVDPAYWEGGVSLTQARTSRSDDLFSEQEYAVAVEWVQRDATEHVGGQLAGVARSRLPRRIGDDS